LLSGLRHVAAGAILALAVMSRGVSLPPRESWRMHALLGALMISIGNGCLVWAQQFVPSGIAAVMVSVIPFWMVGVEALMPGGEKIRLRQFMGLVLGFGGLLLLVSTNFRLQGATNGQIVLGVVALQTSCLGWAIGSAYAKRHRRHENLIAATALQIGLGGVLLVVLGTLAGEWGDIHVTARGTAAMAYLLIVGSFIGYLSYVYALKHLPVSTVSLYAYVNPVIAVILGALILHEPFTPRMAIAIGIISVAMAIVRPPGKRS
jgi:drug/metabolite transporter (DMT)-like permease